LENAVTMSPSLQRTIAYLSSSSISLPTIPNIPNPELYVAYNGKAPLRDEISAFEINQPNIKINVQVKIRDIHFEKPGDTSPENGLAGYTYLWRGLS